MSLRGEVTTHPRYARDVLATSHFLALLLHDRVVERLESDKRIKRDNDVGAGQRCDKGHDLEDSAEVRS